VPLPNVSGRVALITGASQGIGRGIALALGDAGATIYLTGRNHEALESAAAEARERGGQVLAVACDHAEDAQVEALFERIRGEQPGLDLLVNNVWGGYEAHPHGIGPKPFWEAGLDDWEAMFVRGLRPHFAASRLAAPLLIARGGGLIVNTIAWAQGKYLLQLYYDVAKHAGARLAYGMALELKRHQVAAIALAPGFVRTERVMAAHAAHPFDLSGTESPEYIGRSVVYLMADPALLNRTGQILTAGQLAREYGFTDVDGTQPPPFAMPAKWALD
jgi:NAD(P)-dependent dehydrogenase (short-subunit alcohol dehydrogenase family)